MQSQAVTTATTRLSQESTLDAADSQLEDRGEMAGANGIKKTKNTSK